MELEMLKLIRKHLGLEIGEKFKLRNFATGKIITNPQHEEVIYHFEKDALCVGEDMRADEYVLEAIVYGGVKVIKLPYKPCQHEASRSGTMEKKLIDVLREHLGLKRYEEFYVKGRNESAKHRFTETTIEFFDRQFQDDWVECKPVILGELILENIKVVALPFNPNVGETYWTYTNNCQVIDKVWLGTYLDYCNKKIGCVFRSKAEAIERLQEKMKEIMGDGFVDNRKFADSIK